MQLRILNNVYHNTFSTDYRLYRIYRSCTGTYKYTWQGDSKIVGQTLNEIFLYSNVASQAIFLETHRKCFTSTRI